jgi:hypothetical protein
MKTAKIKSMILCYDLKCYDYQYIPKRNKKNFVKKGKKVKKNYQVSKKSIYICPTKIRNKKKQKKIDWQILKRGKK